MDSITRECRVFCRHLIGHEPTEYVVGKYQEYHHLPAARTALRTRPFDHGLLAVARLHPAATRLADAYARVFLPRSVLRKKLVLLLAILETCAPSCEQIDAAGSGTGVFMWLRLAFAITLAGLVFLASTLLFLPCHLLSANLHRLWRQQAADLDTVSVS